VKPFKKYGISNTLDGTKDDVLFEENESSDSNNSNKDVIVVVEILGDSVTSRNFILHCHTVLSKYL
jgi:hypothetical protein